MKLPNRVAKDTTFGVSIKDNLFIGVNRDGTDPVIYENRPGYLPEVTAIKLEGWLCFGPYTDFKLSWRYRLAFWLMRVPAPKVRYLEARDGTE